MGKVIVMNWVTLDGVMQGPGRPDEDTRDGFEHGGWAAPYGDEATGAKMGERMGGDHLTRAQVFANAHRDASELSIARLELRRFAQ